MTPLTCSLLLLLLGTGASAIIAVLGSGKIIEAGYYYVITTVTGALVMLVVALIINNLPRPSTLKHVPLLWWASVVLTLLPQVSTVLVLSLSLLCQIKLLRTLILCDQLPKEEPLSPCGFS
jgi:hypothetical protein